MIKHGKAPYLECSSAGDRRFSAFFARPKSLGGQSIEQAYQAMKVLADGTTGLTVTQGKGQVATNHEECLLAYERWWREWVEERNLFDVLSASSGLSDRFGQKGHVCQATVLWHIRNEQSSLFKELV